MDAQRQRQRPEQPQLPSVVPSRAHHTETKGSGRADAQARGRRNNAHGSSDHDRQRDGGLQQMSGARSMKPDTTHMERSRFWQNNASCVTVLLSLCIVRLL